MRKFQKKVIRSAIDALREFAKQFRMYDDQARAKLADERATELQQVLEEVVKS